MKDINYEDALLGAKIVTTVIVITKLLMLVFFGGN